MRNLFRNWGGVRTRDFQTMKQFEGEAGTKINSIQINNVYFVKLFKSANRGVGH
jgi:hypothetical protein